MTTYTIVRNLAATGNLGNADVLNSGATINLANSTTFKLLNPNGTFLVFNSTASNFTYSGTQAPTAGIIASITLFASDGITVLSTFTGLDATDNSLVTAYNAIKSGSYAGWDYLMGGNDTLVSGSYYGSLFGAAGNDSLTSGSGGAYIRPGSGNNTIVGGTGFNYLSYNDYLSFTSAPTGLNIDISAVAPGVSFAFTNPFGGTESLSGSTFMNCIVFSA